MDRNNDPRDDATLVAGVLAGEQGSFDVLLQRYMPGVTRLCRRILGSEHEAQDVVQEATLQAFLGLPRLNDPARFGAWYHAIAANISYSVLRRQRELSLQAIVSDGSRHMLWSNEAPTLEEMQSARELHDAVLTALRDLSEVNRQAVIGYYLEGYSYSELARLLGVPVSTVKGRLFEGRRLLRSALQPLAEELRRSSIKERKGRTMERSDLVELYIASFADSMLTHDQILQLRVADTHLFLQLPLTQLEAEVLAGTFQGQKPGRSLPHDLTLQLLLPLGAQVQQIVANRLTKSTLYATITLVQGKRQHQVNTRLVDALILAVRMDLPIYMTRSIVDQAFTCSLWEDEDEHDDERPVEPVKGPLSERKEAPPTLRGRFSFFERIWLFLIEGVFDRYNEVDYTQLRGLNLFAKLRPHRVAWEGEPMVALHVLDDNVKAWLLVEPEDWKQMATAAYETNVIQPDPETIPTTLPPAVQAQVDAWMERLLAEYPIKIAVLVHPQGTLTAWKSTGAYEDGVDEYYHQTADTMKRYHTFPRATKVPHFWNLEPKDELSAQAEPEKANVSNVIHFVSGWLLGVQFSALQERPGLFHAMIDELAELLLEVQLYDGR